MITSQLVSYIEKQIKNKIPKDIIRSKLIRVGWHIDDIEEGFLNINLELNTVSPLLEIKTAEPIKIETPITEPPKVWTPMSVPIKKEDEALYKTINIIKPIEPKKNEEFIPSLIPKLATGAFIPTNISNVESLKEPIKKITEVKDFSFNDLPKIAMLSSFESDSLNANKSGGETVKRKKVNLFKYFKIIIFAILVVGLVFGIVWVIKSGYINIKNINIPFIKKDPKVLLLNNSKVLSELTSYKTETSIEISSPSFANISAGLIGGEAIPTLDKDSILINTKGIINQNNGNIISDNSVIIKSSLLPEDITTNIKNHDNSLYVSVPDLSQILKNTVPDPTTVKINDNQFELITPLFKEETKNKLDKINLYKVLSGGITSYINSENLVIYDEFINNAEIIEKDQENIKGIDTYHYSINPDKQLTKKLLNKILKDFTADLSADDVDWLDKILGSVTVSSFEVWVGKSDSNIYQYNIDLDVPISKVIGFDDKSIGNNQINLIMKTTFYDFNTTNEIIIPEEYISVDSFINNINEKKMKKDISSFKQLATNLANVEKSFGNKSNPSGNCMNPVSGSLFSPTGHSSVSNNAVSAISGLLNNILGTTKGAGFCYSTLKDWSFAVPIADNYDITSMPTAEYKYYFCIDSTGATKELITPPVGAVCE